MKKRFLLILLVAVAFITACGSSNSSRSVENLLDNYIKGYTGADIELVKSIYPPFYLEHLKDSLNQDALDKALANAKEEYGDDFNITYNITKTTKLTDEELKEYNKEINDYFKIKDKATECYKYEGTKTFAGSKKEDTDSISSMGYCKYDDSWYLVEY